MTDDSSDVVSSVSSERIGEGPSKGDGTDLIGETGNSDMTYLFNRFINDLIDNL